MLRPGPVWQIPGAEAATVREPAILMPSAFYTQSSKEGNVVNPRVVDVRPQDAVTARGSGI